MFLIKGFKNHGTVLLEKYLTQLLTLINQLWCDENI